jgi:hypothetical protein
MPRAEVMRRLHQSGAVEVPMDVEPEGKGWAVVGREECLHLEFSEDVLVGIGAETNTDKPKVNRHMRSAKTYWLR